MEKLFEEFCKEQDRRLKIYDKEITSAIHIDAIHKSQMASIGIRISGWNMYELSKLIYGIYEKTFENAYKWKKDGKPKIKSLEVICKCHAQQ